MSKRLILNLVFSAIFILIVSNFLFSYFDFHYPSCPPDGKLCDPAIGIIMGAFIKIFAVPFYILMYIIYEIQFFKKKDLIFLEVALFVITFFYLVSFFFYYFKRY